MEWSERMTATDNDPSGKRAGHRDGRKGWSPKSTEPPFDRSARSTGFGNATGRVVAGFVVHRLVPHSSVIPFSIIRRRGSLSGPSSISGRSSCHRVRLKRDAGREERGVAIHLPGQGDR